MKENTQEKEPKNLIHNKHQPLIINKEFTQKGKNQNRAHYFQRKIKISFLLKKMLIHNIDKLLRN
jgi:hypothetical protein